MSMLRSMTPWLRYAAALALVVALYVLLDVVGTALQRQMLGTEAGRAMGRGPQFGDLGERARQVQQQSAPREAVLAPTLHDDALMAGHQLAVASQYLALGVVAGRQAEAPLLADAARIVQQGGHAERVGLGAMQPLLSRTLGESSDLPRRIEGDEGGHAAQLAARLSPRHAHLFQLGFHVGLYAYTVSTAPTLDAAPDRVRIEGHAAVAGIAEPLWQPLALPPASIGAARRDAYLAALGALREALREGRAFSPPAR